MLGEVIAMSSTPTLEERVALLEAEVARLKRQHSDGSTEPASPQPWWEQNLGQFKDSEEYDEAMRLGREYRESLRPADDGTGERS
jgi:hypothetical protein